MRAKFELNKFFLRHLQSATESFYSFKRNLFLNFIVIVVIAAVISLPAIFLNLAHSLKIAGAKLDNKISIYLKSDIIKAEQDKIINKIRILSNVKKVTFISSEQGMKILQKHEGMQNIMKFLPQNPLPPVIEVIPLIKDKQAYAEEIANLVSAIKIMPQVKEIFVNSAWLNQIYSMFKVIATTLKFIITTLVVAIFLIIGSTLSLLIQTRHEEIKVLRLIGADESYIQRVFLYTGVWYSLIGGILAILLTSFFLMILHKVLAPIAISYGLPIHFEGMSVKNSYTILLMSILFGWLSAKIAIIRHILVKNSF